MSKPFNPKDRFFRKAKAEGYRARSAFKLQEICQKHRLVRRGGTALDLGAAPGGFLQVLHGVVGPKGRVVGVDLTPIAELGLPGVTTLVGDALEPGLEGRLGAVHPGRFDLVVSDMAPKTTGAHATDVARSHVLVERVVEVAGEVLRPGGNLVAKVFMGAGFEALVADLKGRFSQVRIERPDAVRSRSRECYLVATGFRGGSAPADG